MLTFAAGSYSIRFPCNAGMTGCKVYLECGGEKLDCLNGAVKKTSEACTGTFGAYTKHEFEKTVGGLTVTTCFEEYADKVTVGIRAVNGSASPVKIGKCVLADVCGTADIGGDAKHYRIVCRDGWQSHSEVRDISDDPANPAYGVVYEDQPGHKLLDRTRHRSVITGDLYCRETKICLNTSFLTFDRANCVIYYTLRNGAAALEALCDFDGYTLDAAQSVSSEILRLSADTSFDRCMKAWADDAAAFYKPKFIRKPALGSLGQSWTSGLASEYKAEDIILANAKALTERLGGFGFEYIWVSIENLKDRVPGNWLECETDQFPDGLERFAEKVRECGLKLGLWIAPFWIPDKFCDQAQRQKDQFLYRGGKPVKDMEYWLRGISGTYPLEERLNFFCRDGSSEEANRYIRELFEEYRRIGVRYYMLDFLFCGAGGLYGPFSYDSHADSTKIAGPEVFRTLLGTIREAAGEDTYLLASTGPGFIGIGELDGCRTGPDIGEGRPAVEGYESYPATYMLGNTQMLRTACRNYACVYHTNGRFYHADSFNVVTVDKPVPLSEAQMTVSLSALFASPMMLGDDAAAITEERLTLLKKALPQNTAFGTAIPLDLFETAEGDCPHIYYLPVKKKYETYGILCLLNTEEKYAPFAVDLGLLGFDGECAVYDFWEERFLGIRDGRCSFDVRPKSVTVLRITPYEARPQLIGTDMHVLQGVVEVTDIAFADDTLTVSCTRPVGEEGTLTILTPASFAPECYTGLHTAKVGGTDLLLIMKKIIFDAPSVTAVIPFRRTGKDSYEKDIGDERR